MQHSIHYTAATQLTNKVQQLDVAKNVFTFSIVTPTHLHFPLGGHGKYFRKGPYDLHFKCKDIQTHLRTVITVYRHTGIPAYL